MEAWGLFLQYFTLYNPTSPHLIGILNKIPCPIHQPAPGPQSVVVVLAEIPSHTSFVPNGFLPHSLVSLKGQKTVLQSRKICFFGSGLPRDMQGISARIIMAIRHWQIYSNLASVYENSLQCLYMKAAKYITEKWFIIHEDCCNWRLLYSNRRLSDINKLLLLLII